ncbi:MAG: TIGR04076 family protein [Candidatus Hodarchaeota archaeon]
MTTIKISVIKRIFPIEFFGYKMKTPSGKEISACQRFEDKQEFYSTDLEKPEGFCEWAWHDLYKDLLVLLFGGEHSWTEPGVMYTSCTDGKRPVCFKLERI